MPAHPLQDRALAALRQLDGVAADVRHYFVPGRIEVLGKHTDYAGGRSLLCAAERGMCFAVAPRADERMRIVDGRLGQKVEFVISTGVRAEPGHWSNYPMTMARRLARNFPGRLRGCDIGLVGDLPLAAGMSSSSAVSVGFYTALADVNGLERRPEYTSNIRALEDLAGYLGTVENGRTFGTLRGDTGVGLAGGSEDQTAILCCKAGELSQYSFCPVRHERQLPLPAGWVFAVAVSGVVADKNAAAQEKYNRAARLVDDVLRAWREATGRDDLWLADAVASSPDAVERLRRILAPSPALLERFEQFHVESNEIVPAVGDRLAAGDVESIGPLVDRSMDRAVRLLKNQIPETIALAKSARTFGATAASAFGGGFGGAVWALVRNGDAEGFLSRWSAEYRRAFPGPGTAAEFFLTPPAPAMRRL
ncbi:MAG TPA: galactokinase family protein [Gemmatimonadales bacterium]|nr:galactokinase family protein [Gemmatimonadales bacterium]